MSQLPPGFVLDDAPQGATAPMASGPVYGAPPKPDKPDAPKTTYRPLSPLEVQARGLPAGTYQQSSEGKIDPIAGTKQLDPGAGFQMGSDGRAVPIPGSKADTGAEQGRTALALLKAAGVDVTTGVDPVAGLIKGSTSGMLQKFGADAYGAVTGDATSGMENIGKLQTIASDLTLQMTGGSLGTQISNADRDFIVQRIGNIADASVPANQRLAAWEQVKKRMADLAGLHMKGSVWSDDEQEPPKGGEEYDKDGNYLGLTGTVTDDRPRNPPSGGGSPSGGPDPTGIDGIAALGLQGISFGLSDESAGIGGFLGELLSGGNPSEGYVAARDAERDYVDKARDAWGWVGTGAELGAGMLTGSTVLKGAMSTPNALATAMRQGAIMGGTQGFGYGEGAEGSIINALAGAGVGAALGAGGQYVGNALAARTARNAPDMAVVQAGQRQGVPIRQPDARPSLRGRMAQAETTETGGPLIRASREADASVIEQRVADVGGQGAASDPYALGSRVQEAGKRYIAKTKVQAGRLYDRARELSGDAKVTARNADAALDQNIQELRAAGENSNSAAIKYLEGLRDDIDHGLSLSSMQTIRSNVRGQISERGLTATDTDRRVGQVLDAMNQDLAEQLPREAADALKAADGFYRERQTFIDNTLKTFLGTSRKDPLPAETAAQRLISIAQSKGNYDRFSRMWQQLEPAEQADVSATIAASLGRKQNGDFSVATLVKSLDPSKGINPRTARLVFGKDGAEALQDLRIIAQAKTETMGRQSPSGIAINAGASGIKKLLWGTLGMIGGGPGGAAAGAVGQSMIQQWGEQRAARMLLNPDFTKWLRNAPNTSNPKAIDLYFAKLATTSIAANDNKAFQQAIMQAFKASPTSAAAQQEPNGRREPPQ